VGALELSSVSTFIMGAGGSTELPWKYVV